MGTTKRDNSKNVDDLLSEIPDYGSYFKKYNKIDESFYNKFKELYNELLASKKMLNELLYNYEKILNDTDFEHMRNILLSLSYNQANYYAALLRLYQSKLDYVDIYSLKDALRKQDRRCIEKLLTGNTDSKAWRRGSPKIGEICEKCYLKIGKRRKACFKPKGFFEFISKYISQVSSILFIMERAAIEIIKKTKYDLKLAEDTYNMYVHIDKLTSQEVQIPPIFELPDFSTFLSQIGKKEDELSEDEIERLKEAYEDFKVFKKFADAIELHRKALRRFTVEKYNPNRLQELKKQVEETLTIRKGMVNLIKGCKKLLSTSDKFFIAFWTEGNTEIFRKLLDVSNIVDKWMEVLISLLDDSIFDYEVRHARILGISVLGIKPFLDIKNELEEKLQNKLIDEEEYKKRIEKLSKVVEEVIETENQNLKSMIETWKSGTPLFFKTE